jgi:putative ABC transport system substrate-binding protein
MPVVGFLHSGSAEGYARELAAFREGLREAGYSAKQNVTIEYRWAEDHFDRLPSLAADLIDRRVALILAAPLPAATAAKKATAKIPIVFEQGADPVSYGLVASLNRPGGNVTGIVNLSNELILKRIEITHEVLPKAELIAVLVNPNNPNESSEIAFAQAAQTRLGIQVKILRASTPRDLDAAFAKVVELRAGALVAGADSLFTGNVIQLAALATRYNVPTIYQHRDFAAAGGLMSYGSDLPAAYRLCGVYAGRILKGEKPADLPVQQTAKVELVINLKTAQALGLSIPLPLLGRADEVIE